MEAIVEGYTQTYKHLFCGIVVYVNIQDKRRKERSLAILFFLLCFPLSFSYMCGKKKSMNEIFLYVFWMSVFRRLKPNGAPAS